MNEKLLKIELYKITREIIMYGNMYKIERTSLDKYGESTGATKKLVDIRGLFHIEKGYVSRNVSDATTTHTKGQPKLLVSYADAVILIPNRDIITINDDTYTITEINNIQEYSIVCDLSLTKRIESKGV